ncbi:MAG: 4Fe-4S binding protein [Oscillospiraceae bacterium]|jgi:NADH-quinone oxidoreductase subunit F|nr:4Fe-4S binding protein [Oscillospiraceae bacterium]
MSTQIIVGKGSCGIAAGASRIAALLEEGLKGRDCSIKTAGCIGMCYLEPIVDVIENGAKRTYVRVDADAVAEIIKAVSGDENTAEQYEIPKEDDDNLHKQTRIALANCGIINPEDIDEYIARDGYKTITDIIREKSPEEIIGELKTAGLGGRGGAGFPTWFKWRAARDAPVPKDGIKYVICNADEGDPGAFMDRAVLEGDPHALIEGMLLCAYAIGAPQGVVYVRAEYPLAIQRLETAIRQAEERGYLGDHILGTDLSFTLRINAGAGAFVCGEETALIASLEGERGMPRLKPPFPAQKGFWQKPSNINNVETYANVPWIIRNGGAAFSAMGTENSKGTKVFALTGKIKKGGLVEIPMGSTIRDVIYGVGGGIRDDKAFKAVQMGGPSGGCIPADLIDTMIDYRTLAATGAIMGSGGMVVMDETTCMVDMARFFLDFTCKESCGKCIHCRIGTRRMLEILTRITQGEGKDGDIELLHDLALQIKDGSLCGLGQTAPNPVLTTIKYFRNEYEDHIYHKKCTAKQCKPLLRYTINAEKCTGCTLCSRKCPVDAITGTVKNAHVIDPDKCIKCGKCAEVCRFKAVVIE